MAWQGPATAVGSDADRRQVVGSADHALGARVSVHPPAGPDWRWLAPGAIVAIAAGIGGVWWLALGVCGLLGGVTVRGYRQRSKVTIFEQGLEVVRREGTRRYPWDQLEALVDTERRVLGSGPVRRYELLARDGTRLSVDGRSHRGVDASTGDQLRSRTAAVLWPRYQAVVDRGDTVRLDTIEVDQRSLRAGDQEISWEGLIEVRHEGARLVFTHANGTVTRVDGRLVPNLHLVPVLAEHLKR